MNSPQSTFEHLVLPKLKGVPALPWLVIAIGLAQLYFHYLPEIPPIWPALSVAIVFGVIALLRRWHGLWLVVAAASAFAWTAWNADQLAQQAFPEEYINQQVTIIGYVASMPKKNGGYMSVDMAVEKALIKDEPVPIQGIVTVRMMMKAPGEMRYGQRWQFKAKLMPYGEPRNPGATFDFRFTRFWLGITAGGEILGKPRQLEGYGGNFFFRWVEGMRQNILEGTNRALPRQDAGLIQAFTIGTKHQITCELWQSFIKTGTVHLMVISGSHITLVGGMVFFLVKYLWSRIPPLVRRFPAHQAAAIAMIFTAVVYGFMAGMGLATARATIMVSTLAIVLLLKRDINLYYNLALAAGVLFIVWPESVASMGFWLSFGAVAVIFWLLFGRIGEEAVWKKVLSYQVLVSLGLLPIIASVFGQVPVLSPFANLLSVPVIEGFGVPMSLTAAFLILFDLELLARWVMYLAMLPLYFLNGILVWLSNLPWAYQMARPPDNLTLIAVLAGLALVLLPPVWRIRWAGLFAFIPLFLPVESPLQEGEAKVVVFNSSIFTGKNYLAVVRTKNHAVVLNTKLDCREESWTLRPYRVHHALYNLDSIIYMGDNNLSKRGRPKPPMFMANLPPNVWGPPSMGFPPYLEAKACVPGAGWEWDGVNFVFLGPEETDDKGNCVLAVYGDGWQTILMSGMGDKQYDYLSSHFGPRLQSDLLVARKPMTSDSAKTFKDMARADYIVLTGEPYPSRKSRPDGVSGYVQTHYDFGGGRTFHLDDNGVTMEPGEFFPKRYYMLHDD